MRSNQPDDRKLALKRTTLKHLKALNVRAGLKTGGTPHPELYRSASTCPRCACEIDCSG
jgi:hypothetical protein